jgi:thymidylate synthase (FAD)
MMNQSLTDVFSSIETEKTINEIGCIKLVDAMPRYCHEGYTPDDAIAQAARVSYGAGTSTRRTNDKLIRYLMRHKHMTPFEMIQLKFYVKCPMFTATQWLRHRSGSFNQESARYSVILDEFYMPNHDSIRHQSTVNRQGSSSIIENQEKIVETIKKSYDHSYNSYKTNMDEGLSREQSRIVLPEGRYTKFYWSVNLRNLFHFLELRMHETAQGDIRNYANAIHEIISNFCPISLKAFDDYQRCVITISNCEIEYLKNPETTNLSDSELKELKEKINILELNGK